MMKRWTTAIAVCALAQVACYNSYTISSQELDKLESGQETTLVQVQSTSGESVQISPETPLEVQAGGSRYRITPYNFLLSDTQLVSPDYDLLLNAQTVEFAEVRELSYGKTFGLVGGILAVVGGGFAAAIVLN